MSIILQDIPAAILAILFIILRDIPVAILAVLFIIATYNV